MKSLKSKVILSAVVLIFALVATIGSTFAWFTVSNTVATSNISLNVITTDSLLIKLASASADGSETAANLDPAAYSTYVTVDNTTLTAAGYTTPADWRLKPVTAVQSDYASISANPAALNSMASDANPKRTLVNNVVNGVGVPFNTSSGGPVQIKFWVMTQASAAKDLYMSALSVVGTSTISSAGNTAIQESLRVGVWQPTDTTPKGYIYGADMDYGFEFLSSNPVTYFNPVYSYGTTPVTTRNDYYYDYDDQILPGGTELRGFNKIDNLTKGLTDYSGTALTAAGILADTDHGTLTNASVITNLSSGAPKLIVVTIFIEGWDADATDFLNTIPFYVNFKFSI